MLVEATVLEIKNLVTNVESDVQDLWDELHQRQRVYPTLADPVTVIAHPNAWTLGSFASVIPLGTIDTAFHIHRVHISEMSINGNYEMVLYQALTEIGRFTFSCTDKKDDIEGLPISIVPAIANTQIRAKLACSVGGATAKIKVWYHLHE